MRNRPLQLAMDKNCTDNFDFPMGSNASEQIADLIGIHILVTCGWIIDLKKVRLYWDDSLIFIPDSNGPKASKIHKEIIRAFKLQGFLT